MYSILWSKRQKITDLMEAQKTPCYKKYLLMQETPVCWKRDRLPTPVFLGFPCGSAGKESTCNAGDPHSIPGSGRSAEDGRGYPLRYSWASLVAQLVKYPPAMWKTWVRSLGWDDPLEKGKATHSSILAWRIAWTIQSMGLQGVRHD